MQGYITMPDDDDDGATEGVAREFYCAHCGHRRFRHARYCPRGETLEELLRPPRLLFAAVIGGRMLDDRPQWLESSALDLKVLCDGIRRRYKSMPDHPIWGLVEPPWEEGDDPLR